MNRSNVPIIIAVVIAILLCCLCVFVVGAGAAMIGLWNIQTETSQLQARPGSSSSNPMPAPRIVTPNPPVTAQPVDPQQNPLAPMAGQSNLKNYPDTIDILESTIIPTNNLLDLARRLEGIDNIPITVDPPLFPAQVGQTQNFWVANVDTNRNFQVEATLRYVTDHLYFWIENGVPYSEVDLRQLAETFEQQIYPTNRAFFGSEWTPGVDGDPRLYILLAKNLGQTVAGYYSSADQYSPLAHEYSNAHEMFLLNADTLELGETFTYGVLAHEFQHMIHWYQDRNEETWMNEGFSELAAFLNGFGTGGADTVFIREPDRQLTSWPDNGDTLPSYGSAFLFVNYFLNRFGEDATKSLVSSPDNGLKSVDKVLSDLDLIDPETELPIQADDVFADWAVANYLENNTIGDGRFNYPNYPDAPKADATETFNRCPQGTESYTVHQYGIDYISINCRGNYLVRFQGAAQVGLLPANPYSGDYVYWSNFGDESNMTLSREFDFTEYNGPLTLEYWTWYDLEEDYDYLYLVGSTDNGKTWKILLTPSGTGEDPSGNSYGWAYNGTSGFGPKWIKETVDLTEFAGQKILLGFEYVTDAAVNGQGFMLDDISIPEIGYFSDFEQDDGGWEAAGFVRIQNILPQTFRVSVITQGEISGVQSYSIPGGVGYDFPISVGDGIDEVVFVVSGTTRHTRLPAEYQLSILPQP